MKFLSLHFTERTKYILNFYQNGKSKEASLFLNIAVNTEGTLSLLYKHKSHSHSGSQMS